MMRVNNTASVITGQLFLKDRRWHFFKSMVELPLSLHEGCRVFCIVAIFFQTETSLRLVILKIFGISSIAVLAPFMHLHPYHRQG